MDQQTLYILLFALILLAAVIVIVFMMNHANLNQQIAIRKMLNESEKAKDDEMDQFRTQVSQQMMSFQNGMSESIRSDLNRLNESTTSRLNRIETSVNDSLLKGFEKTNQSFTSIKEQMARIDETQQSLKNLSTSIAGLQNVLTDKKTRGTYGEIELYSLMQSVFGVNDARYQTQVHLSNGTIADCVLFAPQPLGKIVIDSKFPLENYNRLFDEKLSAADKESIRAGFRRDVKKHIADIAEKYIIPGETAEVAYMFVPAEAVFAEIYGHFDEIVQYSYQMNVFIVSPTTLMAYLTAIRAIYLGQERNEKVVEIQQEYIKLSREFERFSTRFDAVAKDFDRTYKDVRDVGVTTNKIINRFHEIEAVQLDHSSKQEEIENHEEDNIQ
jgi:DNA recombination protein RmuC